jgi:hypothetical protein
MMAVLPTRDEPIKTTLTLSRSGGSMNRPDLHEMSGVKYKKIVVGAENFMDEFLTVTSKKKLIYHKIKLFPFERFRGF